MARKKPIPDDVRQYIEEVAQATASKMAFCFTWEDVNYFRAMEILLFNYKKLRAILEDYEGYTAVELQEKSKSIVMNPVQNAGARQTPEEVLADMQRDREVAYCLTKARFDEIDRVVRVFRAEKEFVVIRMYYFREDALGNPRNEGSTPYTWDDVAAELAELGILRDAKSARRWRNKIVNDMAVCMFGSRAAISAGIYRSKTSE